MYKKILLTVDLNEDASWKKAYVKLAPDQKMIEYFEGV